MIETEDFEIVGLEESLLEFQENFYDETMKVRFKIVASFSPEGGELENR